MTGSSVKSDESRYVVNFIRFLIDGYITGKANPRLESFYEKAVEYSYHVNPLLLAQIMLFFRVTVGPSKCISVLQVAVMGRISSTRWAKEFYNSISGTPGDIMEVIGVVREMNLKITNAMRKGYAMALDRFTEKDLAPYVGKKENPRLIDVIILVHPRHTSALGKVLDRKLGKIAKNPRQIDESKLFEYQCDINIDSQEFVSKISTLQFKK